MPPTSMPLDLAASMQLCYELGEIIEIELAGAVRLLRKKPDAVSRSNAASLRRIRRRIYRGTRTLGEFASRLALESPRNRSVEKRSQKDLWRAPSGRTILPRGHVVRASASGGSLLLLGYGLATLYPTTIGWPRFLGAVVFVWGGIILASAGAFLARRDPSLMGEWLQRIVLDVETAQHLLVETSIRFLDSPLAVGAGENDDDTTAENLAILHGQLSQWTSDELSEEDAVAVSLGLLTIPEDWQRAPPGAAATEETLRWAFNASFCLILGGVSALVVSLVPFPMNLVAFAGFAAFCTGTLAIIFRLGGGPTPAATGLMVLLGAAPRLLAGGGVFPMVLIFATMGFFFAALLLFSAVRHLTRPIFEDVFGIRVLRQAALVDPLDEMLAGPSDVEEPPAPKMASEQEETRAD